MTRLMSNYLRCKKCGKFIHKKNYWRMTIRITLEDKAKKLIIKRRICRCFLIDSLQ